MSSLDLRVLVLERQRWQIQSDLDGLSGSLAGKQPLDATLTALAALVGTTNTLPYFTATEAMSLTAFTAYSRTLLALGDAGTWRSTLGLGSGSTITASGTASFVAYWQNATTLAADGVIQIGTGYKLGLNSYPPPVNVGLRGFTTSLDTLRLGGGDTLARWPLDCPTHGHIATLGVNYGPDTAVTDGVDFRTYRARIDLLGVGYRADSGYALRAGSVYIDSLTVPGKTMLGSLGYGWDPPRWAMDWNGDAGIAHLGVAGGPDARWSFTNWGTSYFAGTSQFSSNTGFGYAPDGSYWLRSGVAYIDALGVGQGINPATHSLVVGGAVHFSSSAYMTGTVQFASRIGVGYAQDGLHWIRAGISRFDQTGFGNNYDGRFVARFYADIYCDGWPYTGAGGPWAAYSDRRMKHNIGELEHPLETMCALHGVTYEYNDTADGKPAGVRIGVLADEVEAVLPAWVGELSGYKTTQLSQFEGLCIEAIKALTARVAALEGA